MDMPVLQRVEMTGLTAELMQKLRDDLVKFDTLGGERLARLNAAGEPARDEFAEAYRNHMQAREPIVRMLVKLQADWDAVHRPRVFVARPPCPAVTSPTSSSA